MVLLLICNFVGDFDGKKFYLAFENNGILERLY